MRAILVVLVLCVAWMAPKALAQSALPPTIATAPRTVAEWQRALDSNTALRQRVIDLSASLGLSTSVIRNLATDVFGAQPGLPIEAYISIITASAQSLPRTIEVARALDPRNDPTLQAIKARAVAAAESGRSSEAQRLLDEYAAIYDRSVAHIRDTQGENHAAAAQAAFTAADYLGAAARFARAAELAADPVAQWNYRTRQAESLTERGLRHSEIARVREALVLYRDQIAPLAPRESRPREWALTQLSQANALFATGELDAAIASFNAALQVFTRQADERRWADVQQSLSFAYLARGQRSGGESDVREAIRAGRASLEVFSRERDADKWAGAQGNLALALMAQGALRRDAQALRNAIAAFRATQEVYTRERNPLMWVGMQNNMGVVLRQIGEGWRDESALRESIGAFQEALLVATVAVFPADHATTQDNMGVVLRLLGEWRGDRALITQAVEAHQAALQIDTLEGAPLQWAQAQYNLALAYVALGRRRDARTAAERSIQGFTSIGDPYRMAWQPRALLENLR